MKKILLLACFLADLAYWAMHRNMPLLIPDIFWIKCRIIKQAQKQLDEIAADWQKDIDAQTGRIG